MAASRQEIDLIVNAITKGFDKLTGDIKSVDKAVDDSGKTAKSGGLRFTEFASALSLAQQGFQVVAGAAKFAYDNISQGAQLNLARDQFDNLAASINTTSDALLNELRTATNGMQSDAELIAGATDIINLGLGKTQEETVRLATAVSTLGLDMQQVILTFANNSKARLDALGLSVEGVTTKAAELEAQGFQGDAFDEAVLIGLEEKMTLLGDASESTAGSLQILESSWKNYTDSLKQASADALAPAIKDLADKRQNIDWLRQAYDDGILTYREYQKAVSGINVQERDAIEVMAELNIVLDEQGNIIGTITEDGTKLTAMYDKQAGSVEDTTEAYVQHDATLRAVNAAMLEFGGSTIGMTTRELEEMAYASGEAASSKEQLRAGIDRATGALAAENEQVSQLQQLLNSLPSEVNTTVDLQVFGINTLERAQALLNSLQGFQSGPGGADPYGGLTPGQTIGPEADPYAGQSGAAIDQAAAPTVVNQTNNFNNPTNPNAIATATAEKLGQLK